MALKHAQSISRGAACVTVAAAVATALQPTRSRSRRRLVAPVVGGAAVATFARSVQRVGSARSTVGASVVLAGGWLAESVGWRTGRLFGHYRYLPVLQPQVGGVPVVVPVAWYAMASPALHVGRALAGGSRLGRIAGGSLALTAWDVFLDPQMTAEGYWSWDDAGAYRGIPARNFVGWFAVGAALLAMLDAADGGDEPALSEVGTYLVVGAMESFAFVVFLRDRLVAAVGGTAMLSIGGLAAHRLRRPT